jgi:hypothetical protein
MSEESNSNKPGRRGTGWLACTVLDMRCATLNTCLSCVFDLCINEIVVQQIACSNKVWSQADVNDKRVSWQVEPFESSVVIPGIRIDLVFFPRPLVIRRRREDKRGEKRTLE